ncbi:MAG: hypothetical protein DVB23_001262 [Verrucomicrobia bacterium]|nr:MAG: hypothetical protein DVB23_001262 [Verrucomicrobiota bacterium]
MRVLPGLATVACLWCLGAVPHAAAVPVQHYMDAAGNELQLVEDGGADFGTLRVITPSRTLFISGDLVKERDGFSFAMPDEAARNEAEEPDRGWKVSGTVDSARNSARVKLERYGEGNGGPGTRVPPSRGLYHRVKPAERLRRAREENERAEESLVSARERVRGVSHSGLKAILEGETSWREEREEIGRMVAESVDEKRAPAEVPDYWQTLAELGRLHARLLIGASGIQAPEGRFAEYMDDSGGMIVLLDPGQGGERSLRFEIRVVRGPTAHTGSLVGTAQLIGPDLAEFVDENEDAFQDGKPAILRFRFRGHELVVAGERTGAYHGARAFFDGTYYRLAE